MGGIRKHKTGCELSNSRYTKTIIVFLYKGFCMKIRLILVSCLFFYFCTGLKASSAAVPEQGCQAAPSELRQFLTNVGPSDYFFAALKSSIWSFLLLFPLSFVDSQVKDWSPKAQKVLVGISVSSFFVFFAHCLLVAHERAKKEKRAEGHPVP